MKVTLSQQGKERVEKLVSSGRFPSAQQAVEAALLKMEEDDEASDQAEVDPEILAAIERAERQLDNGETLTSDQVKAELRRLGVNV